MRARYMLVSCYLCVLLLVATVAFAGDDDREPAPRFHAKTLEGEQFTNESVKGKVVLFQFWTTWCPYCKSEESLVNDLTKEFADKARGGCGRIQKEGRGVPEGASSQMPDRAYRRH